MNDLREKSLASTPSLPAQAYPIEEVLPVAWGVVVGVCQETEGDPALGCRAVSVVSQIQDDAGGWGRGNYAVGREGKLCGNYAETAGKCGD